MTARTYTPSLSLSMTTCSTCDAVWFGADAFLPLLPTLWLGPTLCLGPGPSAGLTAIDSQSLAVGLS